MEQFRTFTIKSKKGLGSWFFRFHLDGSLYSYTVLKGRLNIEQARWLFKGGHFPIHIDDMKAFKHNFGGKFIIEETVPEMNFEYFWKTYNKKVLKKQATDFWKKMNEKDRILAITGIKKYREYCESKKQDLQDPIRYLRNRRYEDEY